MFNQTRHAELKELALAAGNLAYLCDKAKPCCKHEPSLSDGTKDLDNVETSARQKATVHIFDFDFTF